MSEALPLYIIGISLDCNPLFMSMWTAHFLLCLALLFTSM